MEEQDNFGNLSGLERLLLEKQANLLNEQANLQEQRANLQSIREDLNRISDRLDILDKMIDDALSQNNSEADNSDNM